MGNHKKAKLSKRLSGTIPIVAGRRAQGKLHRTVILEGDCVMLRIDTELVQVNNVELLGEGKLRGCIHGFEPSHGRDYQGHKIGDIIDFEEEHVFTLHIPGALQ